MLRRGRLAGESLVVNPDEFAEPETVILRHRLDSQTSCAVAFPRRPRAVRSAGTGTCTPAFEYRILSSSPQIR